MHQDKAKSIIEEARSWLNTPWIHNECQKGVGVDCVNFLFAVGKTFNYECANIPERYSRISQYAEIENYLNTYFIQVDKDDRQECDLLCFEYQGYRTHVAMVTDQGMIHASLHRGKVVEHVIDAGWEQKLIGVWRIKDNG